jgi:hypothetical protein
MVMLGLGIGPSLPLMPLIAQNLFEPHDLGVVTGTVTFFRTIGGAVGTAVLGTIFNNQLKDSLTNLPTFGMPKQLVTALSDPNVIASKTATQSIINHLPAQAHAALTPSINAFLGLTKSSIASSVAIVFTTAMALAAASLVLFYLVDEKELRSSHTPEESVVA